MVLNHLDLFTGIGGFSLALRNTYKGKINTYFSEIDKFAIKIFQKHFPDAINYGNVKAIQPGTFPHRLNLITFGFPCQDISIAGKRMGLQGKTRSSLYFEAIRIIDAERPEYFIFENVKGLFSSHRGKDFLVALRTITNIGYDCQWQLLNTKWFLPQNRERIFLVGYLRGATRPEIFPIGESTQESSGGNEEEVTTTLDRHYYKGANQGNRSSRTLIKVGSLYQEDSDAGRIYNPEGIATTLKGEGGGLGAKTGLYTVGRGKNPGKFNKKNSPTLTGSRIEQNLKLISDSGLSREKEEKEIVPPLRSNTGAGSNNHLLSHNDIRRLTPTECERLQGFPDSYTATGLEIVKYLGNIPINKLEYICEKNAKLRDAIETLLREKKKFVSCTIKDYGKQEQQIDVSLLPPNANIANQMLLQEDYVENIINLGKDTVTLCNQNGILNTEEKIKKNLIHEKTGKKSILPLWRINLEESYNQERLSTILTWIKEISKNQIFTYVKTEKPITTVIIHWNSSPQNCLRKALLSLRMGNIIAISDTQRYKCLGNAISIPVVEEIFRRLYAARNK